MENKGLVLCTVPVDILGYFVAFLSSEDVGRLWATGNKTIQSRLAIHGVAEGFCFSAYERVPSIIYDFQNLQRLELRERYNYSYGVHSNDFLIGFDPERLPKSLLELRLHFPNALARLVGHSLNSICPNLTLLSLSAQYVPTTWPQVLLQNLPPLTQLDLPDSIILVPSQLASLPRTLTALEFFVMFPPASEEQVRTALTWPALRKLRLACQDNANWSELAPENIEEYTYRDSRTPKNMNNPLEYGEEASRRSAGSWTPPPLHPFSSLPSRLLSLCLYRDTIKTLSIEHVSCFPRTITKLQLGCFYDWATDICFNNDPALVAALPPALTELTTIKYIISRLETYTALPPMLKKWTGLYLNPNVGGSKPHQNLIYFLRPQLQMSGFISLIDEQVPLLPPSTDSLTLSSNATYLSEPAGTELALLPLTRLSVFAEVDTQESAAIHSILQALPSTLVKLDVTGEPLQNLPLKVNWHNLQRLASLDIPTSWFFANAASLPSTITYLRLSGDIPQTVSLKEWEPTWPAALTRLRIHLCSDFMTKHMPLWSHFPPTLRDLEIRAQSFLVLPDWNCLRCRDLIDLSVSCGSLSFFTSAPNPSFTLSDHHLLNLPPKLRTLTFAQWKHSLTLAGFNSLPESLHHFLIGTSRHSTRSDEYKEYFSKFRGGYEVYVRPRLMAQIDPTLLKSTGLDYALYRRQFELLCLSVPTVSFVTPSWHKSVRIPSVADDNAQQKPISSASASSASSSSSSSSKSTSCVTM